jgi:AAA domain
MTRLDAAEAEAQLERDRRARKAREARQKKAANGQNNTGDAPRTAAPPNPQLLKRDRRLILSSARFVQGFVPPDYVIFGLLQRRFLYSLTGKTGAGKTAILLLIAAHVAEVKKIGDREVEKGRVLYLAGENADDVRMRWIALAQQMGFDLETIDVHFIPGVFKISEMQNRIRDEIKQIGPVSLIIVDTAAAYFEGDDENSNTQFGDYARRTLRPLTTMPGEPCVIVACHPVKNASDDNLIPRGGGAFLNEVDGNLTAARAASGVVEVHWQGKYRGPDFAPIHFTTRSVTHEQLKDSKGRLIPTVVASPLSEQGHADIVQAARSRQDELLVALRDPANRKASQIDLARHLGWKLRDGQPHHVAVKRAFTALEKDKLVTGEPGRIELTKKGEKALSTLVQNTPDLNTRCSDLNTSEQGKMVQ